MPKPTKTRNQHGVQHLCELERAANRCGKAKITVSKIVTAWVNEVRKAALRSVRRFLRKKGFLRRKQSGTITTNPDHLVWRDTYIRKITANRTAPPYERLSEVYTDESYVHQHHYIEKDDLYHPSILL